MKRGVWVGAGVGIVAVTVAIAFALRDSGLGDGPLEGSNPSAFGGPAAVGQVFSGALDVLTVEGDQPAVIESVRVLGLTGPIEFLGVETMRFPREGGTTLGENEFPPPGYDTKPLAEQNVVPVSATRTPAGTPEEGLQLFVGVRVTGPGIARYRGVEVTYTVGGKRHREAYETAIFLCAPESDYTLDDDSCPGEAGDVYDDRSAVASA